LLGKTDPVGAGDTVVSALACCLGAGIKPAEAAEFAVLAAAVTVQKLLQTGTATGAEILAQASDAEYIYRPELSENAVMAKYLRNSEVEICCKPSELPQGAISHVIFDHEGTVSVLRQGWDEVMARLMERSILGARPERVGESLRRTVRERVREYVGETAGRQTIVQMEALVEMIREFHLVPQGGILDKIQYMDLYLADLRKVVRRRLRKLERGELDYEDFTIKGAVPFLKRLREKGVTLYLTSGTETEDVEAEAKALGYAEVFNGGIYGTTGVMSRYPKKIVLRTILRDIHIEGSELAFFGDGPIEMQECRKYGGTSVGIASDEIRRHGLNEEKRTRLVKAGAHLIIPDYSECDKLIEFLFSN
jgi:phosphoglycolate phosphatase-like HAD superfamily hydrolase